jgi:hypothetical protein
LSHERIGDHGRGATDHAWSLASVEYESHLRWRVVPGFSQDGAQAASFQIAVEHHWVDVPWENKRLHRKATTSGANAERL